MTAFWASEIARLQNQLKAAEAVLDALLAPRLGESVAAHLDRARAGAFEATTFLSAVAMLPDNLFEN